ncbi:CDP-diacylglycerol--glycerol-3-phosphate 3-phosphatidyltransferase [Terricaulis sp.]|uniref:CDP-diacylglycerol--glycerol-3-phosphate 3-phosphatidyltransferase n=1 Tax=Terricaulis sp. TaxID=2768686 RepID=UPI003784FF32
MTTSTTNADAAPPRKSSIPVALTVFRIAMGPVIAGLILTASYWVHRDPLLSGFIYAFCTLLFVLAAATDWLDGYFARKLDAVTPLGAALDHSADKVLIVCVLVALAYAALPFNLVIAAVIILGRDVLIAGLREGLADTGKTLPVSQIGKWKAAGEMAGVAVFLAFQAGALLNLPVELLVGLSWAARLLLWAAAGLAILSAAQYIAAILRKP